MIRKSGEGVHRMTIYLENETDTAFGFDTRETAGRVAEKVLELENALMRLL